MKIVKTQYTPGVCDWSGCNNRAVSYIMLASGAVHLCRKHAAQHGVQPNANRRKIGRPK